MTDKEQPRPTDTKARKIDETTRAATEIIDAETAARDEKTARLKAARERAEAQEQLRRNIAGES